MCASNKNEDKFLNYFSSSCKMFFFLFLMLFFCENVITHSAWFLLALSLTSWHIRQQFLALLIFSETKEEKIIQEYEKINFLCVGFVQKLCFFFNVVPEFILFSMLFHNLVIFKCFIFHYVPLIFFWHSFNFCVNPPKFLSFNVQRN